MLAGTAQERFCQPTPSHSRLSGKSAKTCQALFVKIFRYACRANQWLNSARLTANEGRLEIVTNVR